MAEEQLPVQEKQRLLRLRRSVAEKTYRKALRASGKSEDKFNATLKEGDGKGKEPKPWCECHNRNPCPIDVELNS